MSIRKRQIRKMRKNIMRIGTITKEFVSKRDDDGTLWPKKDWGYVVEAIVNDWRIYSPDDSWYGAYQGCLEAAKMCIEMETRHHTSKGEDTNDMDKDNRETSE